MANSVNFTRALGSVRLALDIVGNKPDTKEGHLEQLHYLHLAQRRIENLIVDQVGRLRSFDDASWTEIGKELEVTKQAAQQRYGA